MIVYICDRCGKQSLTNDKLISVAKDKLLCSDCNGDWVVMHKRATIALEKMEKGFFSYGKVHTSEEVRVESIKES